MKARAISVLQVIEQVIEIEGARKIAQRWPMTKRWLKACVALAAASTGLGCTGGRLPSKATGEPLLAVRGQVKHGPFELGRRDLAALPRAGFRARAPGAAADARFDGVALLKVLEYEIEPIEQADTLIFVAKDGVAIPITGAIVRQYRPILADEVDGAPVAPRLAWPNLDQRGLDADPRAGLWWSGPIEAVEVLAWEKTWGRALRPPPGSSDAARLGAGQYLMRCAGCHRLHGVGGQRGPALDGTVARLGVAPFVASVQRHPGWPVRVGTELTAGEDVAAQVAAFLSTSDQAGVAPPEEEVKPPAARPARRPGY
jgi:hypothetical protein